MDRLVFKWELLMSPTGTEGIEIFDGISVYLFKINLKSKYLREAIDDICGLVKRNLCIYYRRILVFGGYGGVYLS